MEWATRWGYEMARHPSRQGVYRLKAGGFFVRSKPTIAGKRTEISAVLHEVKSAADAQRKLDALIAEAKAEASGAAPSKTPWSTFCALVMDRRVRRNEIQSASTRERWAGALKIIIPAFAHLRAPDVRRIHIQQWLDGPIAEWMSRGKTVMRRRRVKGELVERPFTTRIKPTTVNGWLRILKTVCNEARADFELPTSAFDGIKFFDEGRLYTRKAPNSLPPHVVGDFLAIAATEWPQHHAMMMLGFTTGLRPSEIRPLRRAGDDPDIDWDTGVITIRRSHSRKQTVMDRTKTGKDREVTVPESVLEILKRHVASLKGKQAESDLLFPGRDGRVRTRTLLSKPFAAINEKLGLPYKVTPRAMRRSFQDIARAVSVNDLVTRSISGHSSEKMQHHYSTAADEEQRAAIERIHGAIATTKKGGLTGGKESET